MHGLTEAPAYLLFSKRDPLHLRVAVCNTLYSNIKRIMFMFMFMCSEDEGCTVLISEYYLLLDKHTGPGSGSECQYM